MDFLIELILLAVTLLLAYIAGQAHVAKKTAAREHLLPPDQQLPTPPHAPHTFLDDDEEDDDDEDEDEKEYDSAHQVDALAHGNTNSSTTQSSASPTHANNTANGPSGSTFSAGKKRRVVIVAKTLPVRTIRTASGEWLPPEWDDTRNFLSALRILHSSSEEIDIKWVGSPNVNVELKPSEYDEYEEMLYDHDCIPVFLPKSLRERFFHGFCKTVLWPMLHYVMPQSNQHFGEMWDDLWQAFTAANTLYASVVTHAVETPTDMIWVQNYHLLLLPSLLRTKLPRAKIGLFIHTPFPSSDVFRVLPTRQNILSSIMASDLIGFHTFDYARHFLSCIKRVMDLDFETLPGGALGVKYNGRFVSILISHVGIDGLTFRAITEKDSLKQRVAAIKQQVGADKQIVLGIDDYDVVKGPLLKLQAFHHFLRTHPEWHQRMQFVQFFLPSSNKDDTSMKAAIASEVATIHKDYGEAVFRVIDVKNEQELSMEEMTAWYVASSVCCVSTFWDGLNLIPYEYSACQPAEAPGTLVISEFMGCSRSLNGVLRVNPWSISQVSDAINTALTLSLEERKTNHARRYNYVIIHSIARWGLGFLEQLDKATKFQASLNYVQVGWGSNVKLMGLRSDFTHLEDDAVTSGYRKATKRVLLLDYDGTLTPLEKSSYENSVLIGPTPTIKRILRALCDDEDNCVFIMSGRTRSVLTEWFHDLPELGLAAEKGLFLRWPARLMASCRADDWKEADSIREREEWARKRAIAQLQRPLSLSTSSDSRAHPSTHDHTVDDAASTTNPVIDNDWECLIPLDDINWKDTALTLIESYQEQTDGSWIEPKEFALVWHYENADPEYGRMQAAELQKYLIKLLGNPAVDVVKYDYARVLEVKPHGISKGLAATAILESLFLKAKIQKNTSHASLLALQREATSSAMLMSPTSNTAPTSTTASAGTSPGMTAIPSVPSPTSPFHTSSAAAAAASAVSTTTGNYSNSRPNSPSMSPMTSFDFNPRSPFLLCIGDDRSDEDMFVAVNEKEYLNGVVREGGEEAIRLRRSWSTREREREEKERVQNGGEQSSTTTTPSTTTTATTSNGTRTTPASLASTINADVGLSLVGARKDEEEEKWDSEVLKPKNPPDPFTFTVCVGMKPSNAHYYLHDDEEVLRTLFSLATCSQRMAQTRAIDNAQINELVRNASVGTLAALMLNRTPTLPASMPSHVAGGSHSNLVALNNMQQNSLSVGANAVRPAFVLSAMSPLGVRPSASDGGRRRGGMAAGSAFRGKDVRERSDEEEEDDDDDADDDSEENEYASGSDEEGGHIAP